MNNDTMKELFDFMKESVLLSNVLNQQMDMGTNIPESTGAGLQYAPIDDSSEWQCDRCSANIIEGEEIQFRNKINGDWTISCPICWEDFYEFYQ
jgi:hypothetical protein